MVFAKFSVGIQQAKKVRLHEFLQINHQWEHPILPIRPIDPRVSFTLHFVLIGVCKKYTTSLKAKLPRIQIRLYSLRNEK